MLRPLVKCSIKLILLNRLLSQEEYTFSRQRPWTKSASFSSTFYLNRSLDSHYYYYLWSPWTFSQPEQSIPCARCSTTDSEVLFKGIHFQLFRIQKHSHYLLMNTQSFSTSTTLTLTGSPIITEMTKHLPNVQHSFIVSWLWWIHNWCFSLVSI